MLMLSLLSDFFIFLFLKKSSFGICFNFIIYKREKRKGKKPGPFRREEEDPGRHNQLDEAVQAETIL